MPRHADVSYQFHKQMYLISKGTCYCIASNCPMMIAENGETKSLKGYSFSIQTRREKMLKLLHNSCTHKKKYCVGCLLLNIACVNLGFQPLATCISRKCI